MLVLFACLVFFFVFVRCPMLLLFHVLSCLTSCCLCSQTNIAINSVYLLLLLSLVQDDLKLISFLFSYKPKPVVDVKKGDDVTPDDANDKGKDKTETADIDSLKKQE